MGGSRNILIGLAAISLGWMGPAFTSFGAASAQVAASATVQPPTPDWAKGLVIYEVATKAFTSPNGPESGTFQSLEARLPYLQKLGINAIWLTGYSLSDPHHFYNIWTQYAVIEPGKIDPSLGTPRQFRALIDDAHRRNIKVFLDVITHGLMPDSSVVKQHPDWFRGGSWGMVDFDWYGGHTDLDNWWVKVWTSYVANYGVDGFRLDVDIYRPDLWSRIRQNAAALGHPIVIFIEGAPVIPGVTDFTQSENRISIGETGDLNAQYIDDIPGLFREKYSETEDFSVAIEYSDGRRAEGSTNGNGPIHVTVDGFTTNRISYQPTLPAGRSERKLTIGGLADSPIKSIVVTAIGENGPPKPRRWVYGVHGGAELSIEGKAPVVDLFLSSFFAYSPSLQLSCHDNGWEGFPSDKNPYAAAGSRATFGYSFLFTPMVPIFMAGEEFDAGLSCPARSFSGSVWRQRSRQGPLALRLPTGLGRARSTGSPCHACRCLEDAGHPQAGEFRAGCGDAGRGRAAVNGRKVSIRHRRSCAVYAVESGRSHRCHGQSQYGKGCAPQAASPAGAAWKGE